MIHPRFLTVDEADLIQQATEHWLRLRDVEFNPAEDAAALLAAATIRDEDCAREDIASMGRTILLDVPGEPKPIAITLVSPEEEDLWRARVSITNDLGLECIGKVMGSHVRIPLGKARLVGFGEPGQARRRQPAAHPG